MNENRSPAEPAAAPPRARTRGLRLLALTLLVALAGIGYGLYWFLHARYFENTDDAYVAADLIPITSEVAGTVRSVRVEDTQHVERGQLLVELDSADAEVAMAAAEAELARTVRQIRALFSQADSLRAQIRETEVSLRAARGDLARREQVAADGAVSAEEVQHSRDRIAHDEAALSVGRESLATALAQVDNTTLSNHPSVLAAAARVREAALALKRTRILCPEEGTVARRSVQIGAHIAAGTPLMAVIALKDAWVDANLKEVQLENIRIGQPVSLHADAYGGAVEFHGRVAGLGAGSGSAFALLPAQNASGNWIKIVQRLPVRVALDPAEIARHPLRVGLSMRASFETSDTSGPLINTRGSRASMPRIASDADDSDVGRRIAGIIAANAGSPNAASGRP